MSDAQHYERIVRRLLETKLKSDVGRVPRVLHGASYNGASGQSYMIDLSFETFVAGARILVLVECKCYSRYVGIDDVAEFAYKVNDIGAHKGILVTTSGFQKGATTVAIREGIALVIAGDSWVMQVYSIGLNVKMPKYIIYEKDWSTFRYPRGSTKDDFNGPPLAKYAFHRFDEGTPRGAMGGSVISFEPAIDGFSGFPLNLFDAAAVFLIENELLAGALFDLPDRWRDAMEYGI